MLITRLARAMRRRCERAVDPLGLRVRHLVALTHLKEHGQLSAAGEQMLTEVDRALEAVDDEILMALSTDERAMLNELLARAGAKGPR
ncbi:MAG TPA: hypothetical protein VFD90_06520 [Gaiellales bacterium]|nr:hypothetical protein [Gaiellales bacterium]